MWWLHLWILLLILSGKTIAAISKIVLAQFIPGWWGSFTSTWRWLGWGPGDHSSNVCSGPQASNWSSGDQWSYKCSSTTHSASPFSEDIEPPTLDQLREYFLAHPQGNERTNAFIKICTFLPPPRCLQKLCYSIYRPQLVGVSLFSRGPSSYMLSVWGFLSAYVISSWVWCWRWETSSLLGSLFHVWSPIV
jgi:hypothetical protein